MPPTGSNKKNVRRKRTFFYIRLSQQRIRSFVRSASATRPSIVSSSAFSDSLITVENQKKIKFYAWLTYTPISGAQCFTAYGAYILIVICTKVIDKQCIDTLDTVPLRKVIEILPDRMI